MAVAVAVGLAGALGAVARYLVDGAVQDRTSGPFPFGTLTVNLSGSLVLGFVTALVARGLVTSDVEAVAGIGFCGGFTTWSTVTWETVRLTEEGSGRLATRYLTVSLVASFVAAGLGILVGSL